MKIPKAKVGIDRRQLIAAGAGILLGALMCVVSSAEDHSGIRSFHRNLYGGSGRDEEVIVSGLTDKDETMTIHVAERAYSKEEAYRAMEEAAKMLPELMRGKNPGLSEVSGPLNLPERLPDSGIRLDWIPDDPDLIRFDGEVDRKHIKGKMETGITASMEAEDYSSRFYYPITLVESQQTDGEKLRSGLEQQLETEDERQKTEEHFQLPEEYEGKPIVFRKPEDRSWAAFPLLGFLAAMAIPALDRQKKQEQEKKRGIRLQEDYPEIVSRLVVLSGAGLPVIRAWEKIVRDYEKTEKERPAYEEMAKTWHQMERGMPAGKAMELFGARCGELSYRRLIGLLRQNIRNGSGQFREALENEMERAFEEERNMSRKRGEEASTKLLLPLILMLMIVMVMVSVPAFLTFTAG